jgi:hypothetical protein
LSVAEFLTVVSGNAKVTDNAVVTGNAKVSGDTEICGHARLSGNTFVVLAYNKNAPADIMRISSIEIQSTKNNWNLLSYNLSYDSDGYLHLSEHCKDRNINDIKRGDLFVWTDGER